MQEQGSELDRRVAAGDREAVGAVLELLLPRLVERARSMLWGQPEAHQEAEDAAQSALRTYLRRCELGQFETVEDVHGLYRLLATITCRKVLKRLRKRRKQVDENALAGPASQDSPGALLEALAPEVPTQEFNVLCDELLQSMPDSTHRQVVTMRFEGFSQAEIAERLGYTERNIRYKMKTVRNIWKRTFADVV